jgi:TonB family protein
LKQICAIGLILVTACAARVDSDYARRTNSSQLETDGQSAAIGIVKVRLTVGASGEIIDARIVESIPPGKFDDAVMKIVKKYKFDGDGTKYAVEQEFKFKLDK